MVSIARPSRGERWSATTTRQIGFFLPPTRVSLTRTAKSQFTSRSSAHGAAAAPSVARWPPTLAAAGHLRQRRHLALLQLTHHLLHLANLLPELFHGLHVRPRAECDPAPPRSVQDRRVAALLRRHRRDDRLQTVEVAIVDLEVPELVADAGHHLQQARERAALADLLHLREEGVERELLLADLLRELGGAALVHLLLGLLDERQHVAHAEDPLRHPVGMEALERVELLAGRRVEDRLAGDGLDRQGGAAAGIAIELRQHDAVEVGDLGEALRDVYGVLAGHRVDDEQDVVRLRSLADLGELLHQLLVDVEPAGGVDEEAGAAVRPRAVEGPLVDVDGVAAGALLVDGRARLRPDL